MSYNTLKHSLDDKKFSFFSSASSSIIIVDELWNIAFLYSLWVGFKIN